jgi:hypothetical protein
MKQSKNSRIKGAPKKDKKRASYIHRITAKYVPKDIVPLMLMKTDSQFEFRHHYSQTFCTFFSSVLGFRVGISHTSGGISKVNCLIRCKDCKRIYKIDFPSIALDDILNSRSLENYVLGLPVTVYSATSDSICQHCKEKMARKNLTKIFTSFFHYS